MLLSADRQPARARGQPARRGAARRRREPAGGFRRRGTGRAGLCGGASFTRPKDDPPPPRPAHPAQPHRSFLSLSA